MSARHIKLRSGRAKILSALCAFGAACAVTILALLPAGAPAAGFQLPAVRHVFVITLENENYATTFGSPAADP